ncbi:hypothetical protein ICM_00536 [Bacillus cereus BAG1X2-3]|nr:hypothetical protein ICC_04283 [Bacillus cereus BAG1X1-1]EOO49823.1 hypothetical protein ICK_04254 [Bacillus cereus BAG1X2-2]EOO51980.1 hypothetical protein ICI_01099 [Bacillus cereus BAG1X2-1]EOO61371.1 hypothetical protein ICM_00536 [Bacillus cereus BAG1X2-3]EOP07804.1 hypothetical protein ICO_01103 [Bacillus cereus BAG2O-1]
MPPMLVWEDQEYHVTNEPAKVEEVGQKLGEVTKKLKQVKNLLKIENLIHYKRKQKYSQ